LGAGAKFDGSGEGAGKFALADRKIPSGQARAGKPRPVCHSCHTNHTAVDL